MRIIKSLIKTCLDKFGYSIYVKGTYTTVKDPFADQKLILGSFTDLIIFDVGAHYGQTAQIYNELLPGSKIYSFEPFKPSYDILLNEVKMFSNIQCYNIGLSDTEGESPFYSNTLSATNSFLETHEQAGSIWGDNLLDTIEVIPVKTTTIDQFITANNIDIIHILKLDTQGTELKVIQGALEACKLNKVYLIYLEIIVLTTYQNQRYADEILHYLRNSGFTLYNIYNLSYTKSGFLRQIDALFINNDFAGNCFREY